MYKEVNRRMPNQDRKENLNEDRRKRVRFLKKLILAVLIVSILFPIILSTFLLHKVLSLETQMNQLQKELHNALVEVQTNVSAKDKQNNLAAATGAESETTQQAEDTDNTVSSNLDNTATARKIYLTFDDGPSEYTNEILEILKENDIKATFFLVGKENEKYADVYKRIAKEGHTIGMHSFRHEYATLYQSTESFISDTVKLQNFLLEKTGVWSTFYRFPGGSSTTVNKVDMDELIQYLNEQGITYFDWNISSGDAAPKEQSVDSIVENVTKNILGYHEAVILFHDSSTKRTTVEALPIRIKKLKEMDNTQILPITRQTKPIQHKSITNE